MNSPWYNKSLVYLTWTSHQAIIKQSFSSLNLFISFSWEKGCKIMLSRVTQAVGRCNRLNWRPHHSVFIMYLWQGEVVWLGHCIMNIFDNIWNCLTKKSWAWTKTVFSLEENSVYFYSIVAYNVRINVSPFSFCMQAYILKVGCFKDVEHSKLTRSDLQPEIKSQR